MRPPRETHIYIACAPCQPYSKLRGNKGVAPSAHKDYDVLFGADKSVLSQLRLLLPDTFITEQVKGFGHMGALDGSVTFQQDFCQRVMDIDRSEGEKHFAASVTLNMDSGLFLDGSRPRFFGRTPHAMHSVCKLRITQPFMDALFILRVAETQFGSQVFSRRPSYLLTATCPVMISPLPRRCGLLAC